MTGIETIALNAIKITSGNLLKWGFRQITRQNCNEYIHELEKVVLAAIESYKNKFPIEETDKIPFYDSQALMDEFLKFRFTKQLDQQAVRKAIDQDPRIIAPETSEINNFLEIFGYEISCSPKLKELNIDVNFKEEVFNISEFLGSFRDEVIQSVAEIKKEFHAKNISSELIEEWNAQLDEIFEDIKSFKAYIGKCRLEKLESRINEQSIDSDKLFARLYFLKSQCLELINRADTDEEYAKLLIRIYKLQPCNIEYKAKAALAYCTLHDFDTARKLKEEILCQDEFHVTGWIINCYLSQDHFRKALSDTPQVVKSKNIFKINVYNWAVHQQFLKSTKDIVDLQLSLDIDFKQAPTFSYKNMRYQHLVTTYLLANFCQAAGSMNSELFSEKASPNEEFGYAYKILALSYEKLLHTEIENSYLYYQFQYHCCSFILTREEENVAMMETVFKRMEQKSLDVYIRMVQGYNSLRTSPSYKKAIEVGENYGGEFCEPLQLFIAGNYGFVGEKEKQTEALIKYIEQKKQVDKFFFLNFISFVKFNKVLITEEFKDAVKKALAEKPFSKPEYGYLLKAFCFFMLKIGNYTPDELDDLVEKSKGLVDVHETEISIHIAYAYCYWHQEEKAKLYLRQYINKNEPSESLQLYCKVLYNASGDKIELLEILKYWRNNFTPDYELLQIEFDLRRLQSKWSEATEICKKALDCFPGSEYFINALFISLNNDMQFDGIRSYLSMVQDKEFKNEAVAVSLSKALLRAGLCQESLELLYRHAVKKANVQSRREYAVLFIRYPQELFKLYEVVEINSYVKYEINGGPNLIHITASDDEKLNDHFLGRKAGDQFSVSQKYSDVLAQVTILQVLNKYGALLQELFKEAENPLSGHLLQSFKFKDQSIAALEEVFIENFGARGSIEKERTEALLEDYHSGKISMAEITNSVFKGEFVDAYFTLSNQKGKPFRAISPAISNPTFLTDQVKYVLDLSGLCLFYQLKEECGFTFSQKFYISHLIREQIVQTLEEAKINPKSQLSISITIDKIIPHFYDDGFNERRINTFRSILQWLDANCILLDVPERLNIIAGSQSQLGELDLFLNILIDSRLIVDQKNYILLTNDVFYYRLLKGGTNNIVSPLCFLEKYHAEKNSVYTGFMLKHNYVGIPITSAILNEQFYKMLSGEENWFSICLENLRFGWNPVRAHLNEAIKFIKGLYVGSMLNNSLREQTTFAIFQNLTVGMEAALVSSLIYLIQKEFKLLDIQRDTILKLLTLAVRER